MTTSLKYNQIAQTIVRLQNWPGDMNGLSIRIVDFTSEKAFVEIADGVFDDLTEWRAVHDRIAGAIRARGGRVGRVRLNPVEFRVWRARHGMKDTKQVRRLYMRNLERERPRPACAATGVSSKACADSNL